MDILHDSGYEIKIWNSENNFTEEELIQNVKDIHGIYSIGPHKITKRVIDAASMYGALINLFEFMFFTFLPSSA